jgi:hypothetical protein
MSVEFWRSLLRPKRSLKLLRPVLEDVLVTGRVRCSSTDSLGDSLPKELMVDDLARLWRNGRVGDEFPDCLELGRKKAVAGEALGLENKDIFMEAGGVLRPDLDEGREGVGVSWEAGGDWEVDPPSVCSDTGAERDELEKSVDEVLLFGCRCAMGNNDSGCLRFLRGILKNVVVV